MVAILLLYEHMLVRPGDLSRINAAFFTINGWISGSSIVVVGTDILWHRTS
jgi:4-hydroxybenzoate polyprenyltransferase